MLNSRANQRSVAYKLFLSCEYPSEKFIVIGATPITNQNDPEVMLPSGQLRGLQKGDAVTPLYKHVKISEAGSYVFDGVLDAPITIGDTKLRNLNSARCPTAIFELVNPIGGIDTNTLTNNAFTKTGAVFTVEDGNVVEVQHFNDIEGIGDLR